MNIEGLGTGYQGQGVKTILPAEARAKMEVRLVPGLEPKQVLEIESVNNWIRMALRRLNLFPH